MMKTHYCDWQSLQRLRKDWRDKGHKNVPHVNCSCGFKGADKPPVCVFHKGGSIYNHLGPIGSYHYLLNHPIGNGREGFSFFTLKMFPVGTRLSVDGHSLIVNQVDANEDEFVVFATDIGRKSIVERARELAMQFHAEQKYDDKPYMFHLDSVANICKPFGETAQVIAYLHDTLEDTDLTLAEIKSEFGVLVAKCVELISDKPGGTRKARKTATYIRLSQVQATSEERLALIVKAADRLANVRYSAETRSPLLEMYRKEQPTFRAAVMRENVNECLMSDIDFLVDDVEWNFFKER